MTASLSSAEAPHGTQLRRQQHAAAESNRRERLSGTAPLRTFDTSTGPATCMMLRCPSPPVSYVSPPPCAFLRPGQVFVGRQRVAHSSHSPATATPSAPHKQEHWSVKATITQYDPAAGYIAGCMEASHVPDLPLPVTTFFEGEIIDNTHNSFFTADWEACAGTDILHWRKFEPFRELYAEVVRHHGRCPGLASHPYVYMRWKEQFFVQGSECRLTIQGFYYLCINRVTGAVTGFYFDPSSSPDQKLEMCAVRAGLAGYAFPHYELA